MDQQHIFFPARRRRHRRRAWFFPAGAGTLVVTGVAVDSYAGNALQVSVTVNTTEADPLVFDDSPDPAKWTARYDGKRFNGVIVSSPAYDRLVVSLLEAEADPGSAEIQYSADPSDIHDASGRELGAFVEGL